MSRASHRTDPAGGTTIRERRDSFRLIPLVPLILERGEMVENQPSLSPGNDKKTRPLIQTQIEQHRVDAVERRSSTRTRGSATRKHGRSSGYRPRIQPEWFIGAGLAVCGLCGSSLTVTTWRQPDKSKVRCAGYALKTEDCTGVWVKRQTIDACVDIWLRGAPAGLGRCPRRHSRCRRRAGTTDQEIWTPVPSRNGSRMDDAMPSSWWAVGSPRRLSTRTCWRNPR